MPFPNITSSGSHFSVNMKGYYSPGVTTIRIGDMKCDVKDVSVCYDIRTSSIIVPGDAQTASGRPYELKYARQETGGSYFDVTVTSPYFTMHATKLRVIEKPDKVEFRLLPSTK